MKKFNFPVIYYAYWNDEFDSQIRHLNKLLHVHFYEATYSFSEIIQKAYQIFKPNVNGHTVEAHSIMRRFF